MPTDNPSHNHNSELPVFIATQDAIHSATEDELRGAVEEVFGDLEEEVTWPDLKTRCVMALLSVKYEDRQLGENKLNFIQRRNDIMATTIKKKLTAELDAKGAKRTAAAAAKTPAAAEKAPKKAKATPTPADGETAAPRGRTASFNKVKVNPAGGESKLNAASERAQVFELIKKAGAKGITVEALDEAFAEVCAANEVEAKKTRGFLLKLIEKKHIIVVS